MELTKLFKIFSDKGCRRLYAKFLAENDNSKNQIYFGSDFKAINILPYHSINTSAKNFKAKLDFSWIDNKGNMSQAPNAQLVLYPQYPEVRFSGFLMGCKKAPSETLKSRQTGRVLFMGISENNSIIGFVVKGSSIIAREITSMLAHDSAGVFYDLTGKLSKQDTKSELLENLKRIHLKEWIDSKRLNADMELLPCNAPNCGGYTLEAELGVSPNGRSEPDFLGWEVKQHKVSAFDRYETGVITLMTPEPTGGYYKDHGVIDFVMRYGYKDTKGREDRMNFGGVHRYNSKHKTTGLRLLLLGYDNEKNKITDINGGIALLTDSDELAAFWKYDGLLTHWNRKHANAVYVPSKKQKNPELQYFYGNIIRLCEDTDFLLFLKAIASNTIYYDPGIKVEKISSTKPKTKRRSQFRIKSSGIPALYESMKIIDLIKDV